MASSRDSRSLIRHPSPRYDLGMLSIPPLWTYSDFGFGLHSGCGFRVSDPGAHVWAVPNQGLWRQADAVKAGSAARAARMEISVRARAESRGWNHRTQVLKAGAGQAGGGLDHVAVSPLGRPRHNSIGAVGQRDADDFKNRIRVKWVQAGGELRCVALPG